MAQKKKFVDLPKMVMFQFAARCDATSSDRGAASHWGPFGRRFAAWEVEKTENPGSSPEASEGFKML
jgi:hypothetical protein